MATLFDDFVPPPDAGAPFAGGHLCVRFGLPGIDTGDLWDTAVWDTGTWVGLTGWVDATCDVREVVTDRGKTVYGERFEAGVARITLANRSGVWSPWWRTGPYSVNGRTTLVPGVPVAVWWQAPTAAERYDDATDPYDTADPYDGVRGPWVAVFAGVVEAWVADWPEGDARMIVTASDPFRDLAAVQLDVVDPPTHAGELAGARVARLADLAAFRWPVALDAGTATLTGDPAGTTPLDIMHIAAESDGGYVWCDATGTLRFDDANAPPGPVVATFTDDCADTAPTTVAYIVPGPAISVDDQYLANRVVLDTDAGTTSTAEDFDAVTVHGLRVLRRSLAYQSSVHGDQLAARLLAERKDAVLRVGAVTLDSTADRRAADVVGRLELRDRVRVRRATVDVLDIVCDVEAIAHTITPAGWFTTVTTAPATSRAPIAPTGADGWDVALWDVGSWEEAA
jgi:hypothetical protein